MNTVNIEPELFETRYSVAGELKTFSSFEEAEAFRNKEARELVEFAKKDGCNDQEWLDTIFKRESERKIEKLEYRYANQHGYSDVAPYEIVRIVSDKTLEVRMMDHSENKTNMEFQAGGFSAHCVNNHAQDYDYTSNPENKVIRIRKQKNGEWKGKSGRFLLSTKPTYFYDYNF